MMRCRQSRMVYALALLMTASLLSGCWATAGIDVDVANLCDVAIEVDASEEPSTQNGQRLRKTIQAGDVEYLVTDIDTADSVTLWVRQVEPPDPWVHHKFSRDELPESGSGGDVVITIQGPQCPG